MTSSAVHITGNTNTTTSERKESFKCPLTASEAFDLGMTMEKVIGEIFVELESRCTNPTSKKVLRDFAKQNQNDISTFYEGFKYALNCEIGNFYSAKGALQSYESVEEQIANTKPLIIRNIDNFFRKIRAIKADLNNTGNNNLESFFSIKNSTDIYEVGIKVRTNSSELYERLAKLYPEGVIRKAFEEMAQIILDGNSKITSKN